MILILFRFLFVWRSEFKSLLAHNFWLSPLALRRVEDEDLAWLRNFGFWSPVYTQGFSCFLGIASHSETIVHLRFSTCRSWCSSCRRSCSNFVRINSSWRLLRTLENYVLLASIYHIYGNWLIRKCKLLICSSRSFKVNTTNRNRNFSTCRSVRRRRFGALSFLRKLFSWTLDRIVFQVRTVGCVESGWSLSSVSWAYFNFLNLSSICQFLSSIWRLLLTLHLHMKGFASTLWILCNRSFHLVWLHGRSALDHNGRRCSSLFLCSCVILIYHLLQQSLRLRTFLNLSGTCSFGLWSLFLICQRFCWVHSFWRIRARCLFLSCRVRFFSARSFLLSCRSASVFVYSLIDYLYFTLIYKLSRLLLKRISDTFRDYFLLILVIRRWKVSLSSFRRLPCLFNFLILLLLLFMIIRRIRSILFTGMKTAWRIRLLEFLMHSFKLLEILGHQLLTKRNIKYVVLCALSEERSDIFHFCHLFEHGDPI